MLEKTDHLTSLLARGGGGPPEPLQRQVMSTTRFFRNRLQHQTALRSSSGPRVLVVGCSRGCEAYSLAIEAELDGRPIVVTAVDRDPENIKEAKYNLYGPEDFVDFDGSSLLSPDVEPFFESLPTGKRVRTDALQSSVEFCIGDIMHLTGSYDLVVCNNVLIHFTHTDAVAALDRLTACLASSNSVLAVGGMNIDLLSAFASRNHLIPVLDNIHGIWDGWKGDRLSWQDNPNLYVAMPPIDQELTDWERRFCTLFKRQPAKRYFSWLRSRLPW